MTNAFSIIRTTSRKTTWRTLIRKWWSDRKRFQRVQRQTAVDDGSKHPRPNVPWLNVNLATAYLSENLGTSDMVIELNMAANVDYAFCSTHRKSQLKCALILLCPVPLLEYNSTVNETPPIQRVYESNNQSRSPGAS